MFIEPGSGARRAIAGSCVRGRIIGFDQAGRRILKSGFNSLFGATVLATAMVFVIPDAGAGPRTRIPSADDVGIAMHEPLPPEDDPQGPGINVGPFLLFPVLGVSETYDDNIFASRDDNKANFITTITPSLTARAEESDKFVYLRAGGHIGRYNRRDSENFADVYATAEGRFDFSPATRIYGGAWIGRDHEERESPDEVFGREPTTYFDFRGYGGILHRIGSLSLRFGGRIERLDFHDTAAAGGLIINNDDRDRDRFGAGIRAAYAVAYGVEPFLQAAFDLRRYDAAVDDNAFDRDSNGGRLLAGVQIWPTSDGFAEVFAGMMHQEYPDARLKDIRRPAFGASFNWTPTERTRLTAIVDRAIEETTLAAASGTVETAASLFLRHSFHERLTADVRFGAARSTFAGIGREDERVFAGGTLTWRIDSRFSLIAEYSWTGQTSSVDGEAFRRNRVLVGVEGRF